LEGYFVEYRLSGEFMRNVLLSFLVLVAAVSAHAQSNDVALTGGGYFAASNPLDLGVAWALEGSYARKIVSVPLVSLSAELPVAGSFTSSIPTLSGTAIARSYTSLFITPGIRVRLAPSFPISPYVSAGLGYGRFNRQFTDGTNSSNGTFAYDIGGGLDLKVLPFISLRAEVRDFNSGGIGLQSLALGRQNNLFVTAGVALRF
jgi:Outer membrane protein beta-barrel domain